MGPPTRLPWDPLDVPLDPWNPLGAPLDAFFGGRGVVCMIKLSFFCQYKSKAVAVFGNIILLESGKI